jgi:integrase
MSSEVIINDSGPKRTAVEREQSLLDQVNAFQDAAVAKNTKTAYDADFRAFVHWAGEHGYSPIAADPQHVAMHLTWMAHLKDADGKPHFAVHSIERRLSAINAAHIMVNLIKPGAHPYVAKTMKGIRRTRRGGAQPRKPILLGDLRQIIGNINVTSWPGGVIGHRDATILLFGFVGAYRRSELAMLTFGDIVEHDEDGLHVKLRWSKTDQEGKGLVKALPFGDNTETCAPCWFRRWAGVLDASYRGRPEAMRQVRETDLETHVCRSGTALPNFHPDEPLFRPVMKNGAVKYRHISGTVVNSVVHRRAAAAGIDDYQLGAHSLRAGFVTQSFRDGANTHEVMRQTGHKNVATVEGYSRDYDPLRHNAVTRIKL